MSITRTMIPPEEMKYFHDNQIPQKTIPQCPDISMVLKRKVCVLFEPNNARPQDIFFFLIGSHKFVGRKLVSKLSIEEKITGTKCSRITAEMILGIAAGEQLTDEGIILFYRPLQTAEKLGIFNQLKVRLTTEISFPYPYFNEKKREDISPNDFWDVSEEQVDNLNWGEAHIRAYTHELLKKFDLTGKILYDPACSTEIGRAVV